MEAARQDERDNAKNVYDALEARKFDLESARERMSELESRNLQVRTILLF